MIFEAHIPVPREAKDGGPSGCADPILLGINKRRSETRRLRGSWHVVL